MRSSWKQCHATMAPLFASQSQSSPDNAMDTSVMTGEVRATQDVQQFTPTQADGGQYDRKTTGVLINKIVK